jgi:hypothetical protein
MENVRRKEPEEMLAKAPILSQTWNTGKAIQMPLSM